MENFEYLHLKIYGFLNYLSMQSRQTSYDPCYKYSVVLKINK